MGEEDMWEALRQMLGLALLVVPLAAIRWNLAGVARKRPTLLAPEATRSRWRLEIYSSQEDIEVVLCDPVDVPFPVKRVRSTKAAKATTSPEVAWTLPLVELDIEVDDPFSNASITGLVGVEHRVRFVTGNEAVIDIGTRRLRIRRIRFD
ncbi:MAG: hypothetical protein GY773_23435 [Actinomycetia bacterium]|nr:hypothetical protein [Actinomycetes bacterium]